MKHPLQKTLAVFFLSFMVAEATQPNEKGCPFNLNVSFSGIRRIGPHFFNNVNVRELILSNNEISEISKGVFSHMKNLEKLDISYNELPAEHFFNSGSMGSLKYLTLDYNPRSILSSTTKPSSWFLRINNTFPALEFLSIKGCNIGKISTQWPVSFPRLSFLDLSENSLLFENIGLQAYEPLEILHLRRNNMTHLCANGLGNLRSLVLDGNYFEIIDSIVGCSYGLLNLNLEKESRLESLSLDSCFIKDIKENAFRRISGLKILNLARNEFEVLRKETLAQLKSIQELNLSQTFLKVIPDFSVMVTLRKLSMNNMRYLRILANLSASVLNLPNLETLSLTHNNIQGLNTKVFSQLKSLVSLDLSFNQMTSLDISWNAAALRSIELTGNWIRKMSDLNLRGAANLVELGLKQTKIESFNAGDLRNISENVTIHYVPFCP